MSVMAEREVQQPMTVQELIEALQKFPGHLPVYHCDDGQFCSFEVYGPEDDEDEPSVSIE